MTTSFATDGNSVYLTFNSKGDARQLAQTAEELGIDVTGPLPGEPREMQRVLTVNMTSVPALRNIAQNELHIEFPSGLP